MFALEKGSKTRTRLRFAASADEYELTKVFEPRNAALESSCEAITNRHIGWVIQPCQLLVPLLRVGA